MAAMRHVYVNADARNVLQAHGLKVRRVVRVDIDSVLFIDTRGRAETAWVYRDPKTGKVNVIEVPGFTIDPPWDFG